MKSKIFLLGIASLLLSACSNEMDSSITTDCNKVPLKINVVSTPTKAQVSGTFLPANSELGVFVTTEVEGDIQSAHPYNNVKYTGSGTTYADTWTVDPSTPIYLNNKESTAYAYYPRQSDGYLYGIKITNDGTDWMYAEPVENLDINNSTANFQLKHVMSIIRVNIEPRDNIDLGPVSQIAVAGKGCATDGLLDLSTGIIGNYTVLPDKLEKNDVGTLGSMPTLDFWVVTTGITSDLVIKAKVNESMYTTVLSNFTLIRGKVHTIKLIVENKGMTYESVSITDWIENSETIESYGSAFTDIMRSKFQNINTDGVYAVKDDGTPVAYASATDQTYAAVAFVLKGKAYQISKMNPVDTQDRHWDDEFRNNFGLTNFATVDGTSGRTNGYFSGTNNPQLSKNPSGWVRGALADFNGKYNTTKIIAAQTGNGILLDDALGKVVMNFRENAAINEGVTDWFVPACGEWAYMIIKKNEINDLLNKVSGEVLRSDKHWTSTEFGKDKVWYIDTSVDLINACTKTDYGICYRLIREI